jgi:hypothetical protein
LGYVPWLKKEGNHEGTHTSKTFQKNKVKP